MDAKTDKMRAYELLRKLNKDDLQEVLDAFSVGSEDNSYAEIEPLFDKLCPECASPEHIRKGKTKMGLTIMKCKNCGRRFNILSGTPLEKTQYAWLVWVSVLEKMLTNQSITTTRDYLIKNGVVSDIDLSTVSAMCQKLRNSFVGMPLPVLNGVVQVDEKHFRESQKGSKRLVDVLDARGKKRKPHLRATPSKYGTMGPEFSTVCCAVDESGHSVAKVITMGQMKLEDFEDDIACHFGDVSFLCSDMNTLYTQWASIHKVNQYVINSEYHRILARCDTQAKKQSAYEQNKLDYVVGAGIMNYQKMCKFRDDNGLTINRVNAYHNELERYINRTAKGVSTKHLQAWVSFYNYRNNFRVDHGYAPKVYDDAEVILIELLKLRKPITIQDIKTKVDTTREQKG